MSRSPKDRVMLIAIGVMVLFAVYNFLIKPQGTELDAVREERTAIEQGVVDAELQLLAPPDTSDAPSVGDAEAIDRAVPPDPAIATLLRQLQTVAADTGMLHGSISPSPAGENPAGPGGSLQVAISATGSHEATLAYVQRLRDLERLFVIEQIAIDVQADATESVQISGRVFTRSATTPGT